MKHHTRVEEHVREKMILTSVTCDCCGETRKVWHEYINWSESESITETGSLSSMWAADGEAIIEEVDICHECDNWLISEIKDKRIRRTA